MLTALFCLRENPFLSLSVSFQQKWHRLKDLVRREFQLPDFIIQRLRNAVARSKRLTSKEKRLVLGEEESTGSPGDEPMNQEGKDSSP